VEDIEVACSSFAKPKGAADELNVSPSFIVQGSSMLRDCLLRLFNFSFSTSCIPSTWKQALVFPLAKKDCSPLNPSFRPISITSILSRTFEHALYNRLFNHLSSLNFFHDRQFGFRRQRSCPDAILQLLSNVERTFASPSASFLPTIFLDIQKAFDSVWHDGLLYKLGSEAGVTGKTLSWINCFLRGRSFKLFSPFSGETSDASPIAAGVPQGSVISPLLFLIYINNFGAMVTEMSRHYKLDLDLLMFADDIAIFPTNPISVDNFSKGMENLQQICIFATNWAKQWLVSFSPKKSSVVLFSASDQPHYRELGTLYQENKVWLTGFQLEQVDRYTYLGLTLDRSLKWDDHFNHVVKKLVASSFAITRILSSSVKVPGPLIRNLMLSFLYSKVAYSFYLWSPSPAQVKKLESTIAKPLRCMLRLPPSCHIQSILIEFGLPLLSDYQHHLCLKSFKRLLSLPSTHPSVKLLLKLWSKPLLPSVTVLKRAHFFTTFNGLSPPPSIESRLGPPPISWLPHRQHRSISAIHIHPPHPNIKRLFNDVPVSCRSQHQRRLLNNSYKNYRDSINDLQASSSNSSYLLRLLSALESFNITASSTPAFLTVRLNLEYASLISFRRWQHTLFPPPSLLPYHSSFTPKPPDYFTLDTLQNARLRAALRFNRSLLKASQQRLYHKHNSSFSTSCLNPKCSAQLLIENTSHILLDCPRFTTARTRLISSLSSLALPSLVNSFTAQSLSTILILDPTSPSFSHMFRKTHSVNSDLIAITSAFLNDIHDSLNIIPTP
jgi:hypothetical protein